MANDPNIINNGIIRRKKKVRHDEVVPQVTLPLDNIFSEKPEIAEAVKMLEKGDIRRLSFVQNYEEPNLSLWLTIGNLYGIKSITEFISNTLYLRISINARGREDIVRMVSAQQEHELERESRLKRWLGLGT